MTLERTEATPVPRRRGRRILFAVLFAVAFSGVLEVAARVLVPRSALPVLFSPLDGAVTSTVPEFFRVHPTLFWELVPDVSKSPPTFWGDVTNHEGLRMRREVGPKDARVRVACFGDSCTYGLGGPVDDAWPSVLGADPDLDVINAGVPGYSSYQGALAADMRCDAWKPDVVVVQYGINDALAWMQYDRGEVVAPTDVERAPHVRAETMLKKSALLAWLTSLGGVSRPRAVDPSLLKDVGEGATGRSVEQREFGASREALKRGADSLPARVPPDDYRANLGRIASHAPYAVVLQWPRRRLLDPGTRDAMSEERLAPYRAAAAATASDRVEVIDLAPLVVASGLSADQAFRDTVHGTRALSDLVARAVRGKIRGRSPR